MEIGQKMHLNTGQTLKAMKTKKSKSDLESLKPMFFQGGMIIALALCLTAFEWKTLEKALPDLSGSVMDPGMEDIAEITRHRKPELPPPPPKPVIVFNEVTNDTHTEDIIIPDVESGPNKEMIPWVPGIPDEPEDPSGDDTFVVVEDMPEFAGGLNALRKYLADNIIYPQAGRETGIVGTVFLTFIVARDGSVRDVKVLRGIGGGCDEEAIRVVSCMPKWIPGRQRGKAVNVAFNLPISFTLN